MIYLLSKSMSLVMVYLLTQSIAKPAIIGSINLFNMGFLYKKVAIFNLFSKYVRIIYFIPFKSYW